MREENLQGDAELGKGLLTRRAPADESAGSAPLPSGEGCQFISARSSLVTRHLSLPFQVCFCLLLSAFCLSASAPCTCHSSLVTAILVRWS
jgi:hypothetical protein